MVQIEFPENQYFKEKTIKTQIVLHHTASSPHSIIGDKTWWEQTKERVATHFIIGFDGTIYQFFDLEYWSFHLNVAEKSNVIHTRYKNFNHSEKINKSSVGIELDSAGALSYRNGLYKTWYNGIIPESEVCKLGRPHRGVSYFHKYSDAQIQSLKTLIKHIEKECQMDFSEWRKYDKNLLFGLFEQGYKGQSGIYTHCSYQQNKNDIYPDTRILHLLNNI